MPQQETFSRCQQHNQVNPVCLFAFPLAGRLILPGWEGEFPTFSKQRLPKTGFPSRMTDIWHLAALGGVQMVEVFRKSPLSEPRRGASFLGATPLPFPSTPGREAARGTEDHGFLLPRFVPKVNGRFSGTNCPGACGSWAARGHVGSDAAWLRALGPTS